MPWPLRIIGTFPTYPSYQDLPQHAGSFVKNVLPGECFYHSGMVRGDAEWKRLGQRYLAISELRLPIVIYTPGGWWCPDQMAWDEKQGLHGAGWAVTGILPTITVTPSVNFPGRFHSFVTKGVLLDDCEGRKFNEAGKRLP